jgi:hypothetical protein
MSSIAEAVFALTPHANASLRNGNCALSPQLLTLLMLVDGVAPVAQYKPFLKSLHPLEQKFTELETQGYLVRVGNVSEDAVKNFDATVAAGKPIIELHRIDALTPESGFISIPNDLHDPRLKEK